MKPRSMSVCPLPPAWGADAPWRMVQARTIRKGASAPQAGGKVHTDIERGFIRVEVIKYGDFVAAGSEKAAKDRGLMQTRGRDYVIEDGDICNFLFSV